MAENGIQAENGIGAVVLHTDDHRFLTGTGDYTDDKPSPPDVCGVRALDPSPRHSPSTPRSRPPRRGWWRLLTGADFAADGKGSLICGRAVTGKDGQPPAGRWIADYAGASPRRPRS